MSAVLEHYTPNSATDSANNGHTVVVGSGPTGVRFAQALLRANPNAKITLFGNEPNRPYNRVQLSAFLAGEVSRNALDLSLPAEDDAPNFSWFSTAITGIDTTSQTVTDANNTTHIYDKLILAVGSRSHVPNIPGVSQTGVYTFRHLHDTESLYARVTRCRHCVVIGGGLLGLEAARAMRRFNTEVTVVQQATRLMNRQLDDPAAALLQSEVEALGIRVITGSGVREIYGEGRVTGVKLRSGEELSCDTVILCAGITPNVELARNADIRLSRGIVVDDNLRTSAANVYAIGECCEHRGSVYGLAAPGFEQAAVLAENLTGGQAKYTGSIELSKLKVVGQSVCSMGEVVDLPSRPLQFEATYSNAKKGIYRKVVWNKGMLIGAMAFGEWPELNRIQEAYQNQRSINRLQLLYFRLTGKLWTGEQAVDVGNWPAAAMVCQCNGISKGQILEAADSGNNTVAMLQKATTAGTVCGSCVPLLAELTGSETKLEKEKASTALASLALIAAAVVITILAMPAATVADSVQTRGWFEALWNDKFWKQVTGFSMLGLSVLGLVVSLHKRLKFTWLGNFAYVRAAHAAIGALCASLIIIHTGFNMGSNLNNLLLIDFIGILLMGATAGLVIGLSHKLQPSFSRKLRSYWTWLHIIFSWPLPALIAAHILTVYYY